MVQVQPLVRLAFFSIFALVVKKSMVIILALLYITMTSGVVVNIHYCMGAIAAISYGHDETESCGKCGMKATDGCCHTEYKVVKLADVHQPYYQAKTMIDAVAEVPVPFFQISAPVFSSNGDYGISYHSPPDPRVNSIYLHTGIFRI